ncbi:MAG: 6-carboxytetrahydropterin synthase [Bdellovibrionales bacterium]|nr:6-carboxytetrahydropterin synthase [Bdellovibrionales bacterium]NQZ19051.1 6-carboxytetrahydropterin synthase [Bdellovibrionales bacterium]
MKISFSHRFEAAHRFLGASTKCSTPHGHTWWVHLSLAHDVKDLKPEKNYIEDFAPLKKEWRKFIDNELDHHIFLNCKDPLVEALGVITPDARVKLTAGDPTTEALALILFNKAKEIFKNFEGLEPTSLKLQETPTNAIEVDRSVDDFQFLDK